MKKIITFLTLVVISACGNFVRDKTNGASAVQNISGQIGTIEFSEVRSKVFEPHCKKCHSNYVNYNSVKANLGLIISSVEQNRMPKDSIPLSDDLKNLLRTWVAEGASEFLVEAEPIEPPANESEPVLRPTWASLSLNIFEPKCLACHNPTGQAPWIDFTNRASMAKTLMKHIDFKNPEESNLIIRLVDPEEPMPPLPPQSSISQLTEQEVRVVLDWIKEGLP